MPHRVVLDADWFLIDGVRHFKVISYFAPTLGLFGEFTFSLPPGAAVHAPELQLQARKTHHLDWRSIGTFRHDQVDRALSFLRIRLNVQLEDLEFFAKGSEKANLLAHYLGSVTDLDQVGCPRYQDLTELGRTTLNKAVAYGSWLEWSD